MKIALGVCLFIIMLLLLRLIILKGSIRELRKEFKEKSVLDTNRKIGISSRDADLRALTKEMNKVMEELRDKYHLYSQGNDETRRIITNVTHDLRTPLTAICGYLELLKNSESLTLDEYIRYFDIIENRALYMKELTEDLFEFSRLTGEENVKPPEKEEILLNKALEDCIMDYYGALNEKNIDLKVEMTESHIYRIGNKKSLERVLSNLMSNCLKYSKGDLTITLSDLGKIRFKNYAPNVTQLDAQRLFDRYYTVETGSMSTGIGLSIAQLLLTQMNGEIIAFKEDDYLIIELSLKDTEM